MKAFVRIDPLLAKDALEAAVLLSLTLAGGAFVGWAAAKVIILLGWA